MTTAGSLVIAILALDTSIALKQFWVIELVRAATNTLIVLLDAAFTVQAAFQAQQLALYVMTIGEVAVLAQSPPLRYVKPWAGALDAVVFGRAIAGLAVGMASITIWVTIQIVKKGIGGANGAAISVSWFTLAIWVYILNALTARV